MTALEILTKAKVLIANPENWTQEAFAEDLYGNPVEYDDKDAVCWCATGAVRRVCGRQSRRAAILKLREAATYGIVRLNDEGDHSDVMAMFDRAIEASR